MPSKDERPVRRAGREETTSSKRRTQGWGAVAKRQAEIAEAKEKAENTLRDFWLKSGESAIIQFLQDEPYCYDAHNVRNKRGEWSVVPCQLNKHKHCVLCNSGAKQTWRAAFIILDYRGSWDKEKKRFKNDKAVPKLWKVGTTIAQQLKQQIDKRGKDLTELVFEVTRSGEGKDATYNFEPALDEKDRRVRPMEFDVSDLPTAEELCQPLTEDEIDELGLDVAED